MIIKPVWNTYFFSESLQNSQNNKISNYIDLKNESSISPEKYMISSLANGTKINDPIYQKLLSYAIVRSNYGKTSNNELFARGICTIMNWDTWKST